MAKKSATSGSTAAKQSPRGRRAHGVNSEIKASNLRRLKRIEGQVRGVAAMIEDDRYCADVLDQIAAVQNAMASVAREVLRNHLEHCTTKALAGTDQEAACMREELLRLFTKRMS